jgi:hypothetical protein
MSGQDYDEIFDPLRFSWVLSGLLRAVARLALAPDDQREYLRRIGTGGSADELALEPEEFAERLGQLEEVGWIEPAQAALVRRIDGMLPMTSGQQNAALWEPAALSTALEGAEVRALPRSRSSASTSPDTAPHQ